jgi:hypothetical protein
MEETLVRIFLRYMNERTGKGLIHSFGKGDNVSLDFEHLGTPSR